jgi:CRISPR-associated protein Cas5t
MIGLYVTVPIACFRKGQAREYLETESLPPPATCYGFLLSLVGETARSRHVGCRVGPVLLNKPEMSTVLRTVWRVKNLPLGSGGNIRPDYQQLLCPVELVLWLDSTEELNPGENLEARVQTALDQPQAITRFGGLSLGESSHLVDQCKRFKPDEYRRGRAFILSKAGNQTLPVWVDHVGSAHTRYVTGNIEDGAVIPPSRDRIPRIEPKESPP